MSLEIKHQWQGIKILIQDLLSEVFPSLWNPSAFSLEYLFVVKIHMGAKYKVTIDFDGLM